MGFPILNHLAAQSIILPLETTVIFLETDQEQVTLPYLVQRIDGRAEEMVDGGGRLQNQLSQKSALVWISDVVYEQDDRQQDGKNDYDDRPIFS